jgi:hypothetical protein
MADNNMQNTSQIINDSFIKGLNKDSDPSYVTEGMWTHAVNMVNNSKTGKVGSISNESANYLCFEAGKYMPTTVTEKLVIGAVYLFSDKWVIFTAGHNTKGQPIISEIGLFEEENCTYKPIVIDTCLNFDKRYLISGVSRLKEDCTWQIYWVDGLNPDRYLNVGDPQTWPGSDYSYITTVGASANYYQGPGGIKMLWPGVQWTEECKDEAGVIVPKAGYTAVGCITCTKINNLNCNDIRLARLMKTPCLNLTLGQQGGTLANGTYFALIAYTINGQKVTDYFAQSNYQFVYSPDDLRGSLLLKVEADRENFDEFQLVIVKCINQQTVAQLIGVYSTNTTTIAIDQIDNAGNITIPLEQLPLQTPVFETSDQMTEVNNYLLRVGPRSKFDFNYQPLANLIKAKWASVEYPADYYMKGGNKTNYMRDEVYSFFIRWVYNTGDKSPSYHIPGRPPKDFTIPNGGGTKKEDELLQGNLNNLSSDEKVFEVYNTATIDSTSTVVNTTTDDGGVVIATGNMGYWQSTEKYPDNRSDIWNPSAHCWTGQDTAINPKEFDLCGKYIRHHKFPENYITGNSSDKVSHFRDNANAQTTANAYFIRIMGVYFENIALPKDNDGNDIPGIVGYEILRGSREGNKTIVAKGMVNNFRSYKVPGNSNYTGLYANYPFNTIKPLSSSIGGHVQNYNDPYIRLKDDSPQMIPTDVLSFHSPDTMFTTPFLSTPEFKLYGHLEGYSNQQFVTPSDHPKFKLLSDVVPILMITAGLMEAIISMIGKRTINSPTLTAGSGAGDAVGAVAGIQATADAVLAPLVEAYNLFVIGYYASAGPLADAFLSLAGGYGTTSVALKDQGIAAAINTASLTGLVAPSMVQQTITMPDFAYLPVGIRTIVGIQQMYFYFTQGADATLNILYASTQYLQYALQMQAYGFYSKMQSVPNADTKRFTIDDSFYLKDNIQQMNKYLDNTGVYRSYSINNIKRSPTVTLRVKNGSNQNVGPKLLDIDKSLVTLGTLRKTNPTGVLAPPAALPDFEDNIDRSFGLPIASHYGSLKGRVRNQYGQLDSIKQLPIGTCEQKIADTVVNPSTVVCAGVNKTKNTIYRSPVMFGGDTYINRYTEKNNMMFYYDWLYDQPDGFEYNYYLRNMIPSPRFNVNSIRYDVQALAQAFDFNSPSNAGSGALPSRFYRFDCEKYDYNNDTVFNYPGFLSVKEAFFYLTVSSIRDFFVESDVLVDFRKQADLIGNKFYDPYRYTNYQEMFDINPNIMGKNTFFQYDYSLSVSKLYNQYFSSGSVQSRYYNPNVADLCYTYYPNRIIYSLPQQDEAIKDSWFVYLVNNYKAFKSQVSGVKSINKSGIVITFKNDSPVMYQGVDTLQTELGTKVTLGDGGLFSQAPQQLTNADKPYEYGASQNRLSVISTPVGIYYISQAAGKVFSIGEGLQEISQQGMKWWFTLFLPYKLLQDFPLYPYVDNPVAGIGCQSVFDNTNTILYFCKKDYQLKDEYKGKVTYIPLKGDNTGDYFMINGNNSAKFKLGDPILFRDASWTVSYDPKNQFWISFHDWHPDLLLPTKDTFLSTKGTGGWRHNWICDKYCNYYGIDYACEIDIPIATGQTVTTTRSVEYIMEAYRKTDNCVDSFHVLDYNFDTAVIYNSEQVSGYLNLNVYPKNDLVLARQFPRLNPTTLTSFDILFSKEENKYRFSQFWDITKNRGEFPIGSPYPAGQGQYIPGTTTLIGNYSNESTWVTEPDGFRRVLNQNNLDYTKSEFQRKKFRHYMSFINLKKKVSGNTNIILKISDSKNEISQR